MIIRRETWICDQCGKKFSFETGQKHIIRPYGWKTWEGKGLCCPECWERLLNNPPFFPEPAPPPNISFRDGFGKKAFGFVEKETKDPPLPRPKPKPRWWSPGQGYNPPPPFDVERPKPTPPAPRPAPLPRWDFWSGCPYGYSCLNEYRIKHGYGPLPHFSSSGLPPLLDSEYPQMPPMKPPRQSKIIITPMDTHGDPIGENNRQLPAWVEIQTCSHRFLLNAEEARDLWDELKRKVGPGK